MKTLTAILLCGLLAVQPVIAQTTSDPPSNPPVSTKPGDPQLWWCILAMGCVTAGGCIAIWMACKTGQCSGERTLVLYVDQYDGNWQPKATNTVYVTTNKTEVFRMEISKLGLGWRYSIRIE